MAKSKAKHYPPAYYKYRKEHPTVSIVLSKETKAALDNARGGLSYAKFLTALFTPDGVFSQCQKQKAQLASEKVSLENEIKKQKAQLASERVSLKNEKKNIDAIERFYVTCIRCDKQILFKNTDADWNSEIKPKLQRTFSLYPHENCGN